jgi:hypothetical protein
MLMTIMKPMIAIVTEPVGQTYIDLLEFAAARCASFSLVWQEEFRFEQSALQLADALKPFLLSEVMTDEWPGTQLLGHQAIVRQYRATDNAIDILCSVDGLYSWLEPSYPEDLAFYSSGNIEWLASISHEHEAWFLDESLSLDEVYSHVSGIEIKKTYH